MNQGIIAVILSIIFYLTSLLGGNGGQVSMPPAQLAQSAQHSVSSVTGRRAVALGDTVSVRSGPDMQYPALTAVKGGTEVTVLQAENGWYKVRYASGRDGWVAGSSVRLLETGENTAGQKVVLGWYSPGEDTLRIMLEQGQVLTSLSPWGWELDADGSLTAAFDPKALGESLLFAGNHGLKTYALVYASEPRVIEALLTDQEAQRRTVHSITEAAAEWGVHGVFLQLMNAPLHLKGELTAFVQQIAEALDAAGRETTMAVPAVADDTTGTSSAYDHAALAQHVDFLVVMAVDQHHLRTEPGPPAGADWVEKVVQYVVSRVAPDKVVLAIPTTGYHWMPEGGVESIAYTDAVELAAATGAKVRWHSEHKAPYFEHDGHTVWFENRFSTQAKLQIVEAYGLRGIALGHLENADSGIWPLFASLS